MYQAQMYKHACDIKIHVHICVTYRLYRYIPGESVSIQRDRQPNKGVKMDRVAVRGPGYRKMYGCRISHIISDIS